jgi:hypothetical protein
VRIIEASIIGYLARTFKSKLLNKGNIKAPMYMAQLIFTFFNDLNPKVYKAAGQAFCDVYEFSLPKHSLEIVLNFMFEPLRDMITGSD